LKKEQADISFYIRPSKRKGGLDTDDDDDDMYEPQPRLVHVNDGKNLFFFILKSRLNKFLFRTSSNEIL